MNNKKIEKLKILTFIAVVVIFLAIIFMNVSIHNKISNKNEMFEHVVSHIDMPKYAMGMNLFFDHIAIDIEHTIGHIDDPVYIKGQQKQYYILTDNFREQRESFYKIVAAHNAKWLLSQEELAEDSEHQSIHNENRNIISELEDEYDEFIVLANNFLNLSLNGEKEDALNLYNDRISLLMSELNKKMDRFIYLQEWEKSYHSNKLAVLQKSVDGMIDNLMMLNISLSFVLVVLFLRLFSATKNQED